MSEELRRQAAQLYAQGGKIQEIRIESLRGDRLRLGHNLSGDWTQEGYSGICKETTLEQKTVPGQRIVIKRVPREADNADV